MIQHKKRRIEIKLNIFSSEKKGFSICIDDESVQKYMKRDVNLYEMKMSGVKQLSKSIDIYVDVELFYS